MTKSEARTPKAGRNRPPLLWVGDGARTEFRESRACVARWAAVRDAANLDAAVSAMADGRWSPETIVIAQRRPGEFSHDAIDRLRRLAPLARILGLMGSWCEGEMRSGSPWPATARLYWHQWPVRSEQQFARLANGELTAWSLPITATDEERLLADCGAGCQPASPSIACRGLVAIRSRSAEMAGWLMAACRDRRLAAVWQRRPADTRIEGATAGIFDAAKFDDAERGELSDFAATMRPAPVVALLSFPRFDDHQQALAAGASFVLSKPTPLEDLFRRLPSEEPADRS